ncbi:Aldolase-type TIM barrel, partial [Sesbania bispinosa]
AKIPIPIPIWISTPGTAQTLCGGAILQVTNPHQAKIAEQASASAAADEDILAVVSQSELLQPPSPPVIQDPPLTQKIQDGRIDKNNRITATRTVDSTMNSDRSLAAAATTVGIHLKECLSPVAHHQPSLAALHLRPCLVSVSPSTSSHLPSSTTFTATVSSSSPQKLPPLGRLDDNTFSRYAGVKSFVHLPLSNRTKDGLQEGKFVSMTDIQRASEFNDYCHSHHPPIAFIKTEVRILFGSVFCDFGPEFTISYVDGKLKKAKRCKANIQGRGGLVCAETVC